MITHGGTPRLVQVGIGGKKIKTRPVTGIQVREYLAKAEEFLLAATSELEAGQDHRETISLLGQGRR